MSNDRSNDQFAEEPLPPEDEGTKGPARRKRFEDDDRQEPKKNNTLLIVLLVIGGVVVLGGGCCGVVIVGLVMPGFQKMNEAKERMNAYRRIGIAYLDYQSRFLMAPEKADDLKQELLDFPEASKRLTDGSFVFIYGVRTIDMNQGTSRTVLAYEKDVPDKGGIVLFGDGHVEQVTPAEFVNLPKAQKGIMK